MSNLFFIHTPLELFIAQQVINYEKLEHNVMLFGYQGKNDHYTKVYSLIKIPEFWMKEIFMEDVDVWASLSRREFFFTLNRVKSRYSFIKKIIEEYSIDYLYLGDINNKSCKFASIAFNRLGIKCRFFEEGSGHYNFIPIHSNKWLFPINYLYGVAADLLFFLPVCKMNFGAYCFWKNLRFNELPINVRYSVRPYYHESFDRLIKSEPLFSEKLRKKIDVEIRHKDTSDSILFLNTPVYHTAYDDRRAIEAYNIILHTYFRKVPKKYDICIKFHPSDGEKEKRKLLEVVEGYGLNYSILSNDINIPIEYYLQYQHFREIVTFFSATIYYNGYLFPSNRFVSLLKAYYDLCKSMSVKLLGDFELLIDGENELMKVDSNIVRLSLGEYNK